MLPRPTAEPIAERMNTFREPNASRLWVCVVAVAMRARLPEGRPERERGHRHGTISPLQSSASASSARQDKRPSKASIFEEGSPARRGTDVVVNPPAPAPPQKMGVR